MRAIDTNILVRLLVRDDPRQTAAAEKFVAGGAWVSQIVLVETVWVLESVLEIPAERITTAMGMLLVHAQLTLQDSDILAQALARYRARPQLGFSDCLVLESARKAGNLPMGTFDRKLARHAGAERVK